MKKQNILKVVLLAMAIIVVLLAAIFPNDGWAHLVEFFIVLVMMGTLTFFAKEKYNALKVILIAILTFMALTWVIPAAYYSNGYIEQGRTQMGLFDLFNYPINTVQYFGYLTIYILAVGGLYGVLNKIGAYRAMLDKLVASFKGKEKIVLSIIMILLAVLTSICGVQLGIILFIPMVVSLILLMGFDKITAALAVVGSLMIGIAGTTLAYTNVNVLLGTLNLNVGSLWVAKVVILVVGLALLIMNTMLYNRKTLTTKKTTKKSTKSAAKSKSVKVVKEENFVPEKVSARKKTTIWPLAVILSLLFIILVLSFISWTGAFKVSLFENVTNSVLKYKIFKFAIFGKVLGTVNVFGTWTVVDMIIVVLMATVVLSFIYKLKFDELVASFVAGAKKAAAPAFIVILVYACLVIATYHPFQLVIYKSLLDITNSFNVVTGSLVAIISGLLNVDPSYAFQSFLPYTVSVLTDKGQYPLMGLVFQSMYGLVMLVAPTSVVLMGVLAYLKIPYSKWLKTIWKLLLELLLVLLIVFIIIALI